MTVELTGEELNMLISSLQHWVDKIENGTPSSPAEVGRDAYLARQQRRAPVDALLQKLRDAKRSNS
ncbi:MAG TPA: hypothetical protein VGX50_12490 [Longimicrobium sp.]|jgi:hypothetical protein|nr:hypothetical protein [Longimicrobium sp.]